MIHNFHDISCLKDPEIEPDSYFDIHILVSLEAKDKIRDNTYFLIGDMSLCITNFKEAVYDLNGKKYEASICTVLSGLIHICINEQLDKHWSLLLIGTMCWCGNYVVLCTLDMHRPVHECLLHVIHVCLPYMDLW